MRGARIMRLRAGRLIAMALVIAVPVALGLWQLDRARQKEQMRDRALTRAADAAVKLPSRPGDADQLEYRRVVAEGRYEPRYQVFLDNRVLNGRPGFEVVTPFKPATSATRVLVNRGWVPWGGEVREVPEVTTPRGQVRIRGSARVPVAGLSLGELDALEPDAPTVWQYLDLDEYRRQVSFPLQPVVVLLDPQSRAGGFTRQWPAYDNTWIERHRAYAVQWFGLALVAAIVLGVLSARGRRSNR